MKIASKTTKKINEIKTRFSFIQGGKIMNYGYCRCSTNDRQQDITRQIRELKNQGVDEENIYFEYASGVKEDRIQLKKLLANVKNGDTIIATEVSRITRSTKQLCEIIEFAKNKHIKLVLGSFVIDCISELDPVTEGILKLMGVISELERNMISARVKSGLANAKAKGKIGGRPTTKYEDIPAVFFKFYPKYKNNELNKMEFARICGLSYPTIFKYISLVEDR